jgi:hypothetical protein
LKGKTQNRAGHPSKNRSSHLTGAEVMAALDDLHPGNLVTVEVADRLTEGCMENFRAYVERVDCISASFLHVKPKIAIEAAPFT